MEERWEDKQDFILLRNLAGDEILFLRIPVGRTWYRQSRSKGQSIGKHDPAFQLQTGHIQSELALYARKGYQNASSAPNKTTNRKPTASNNTHRRRGEDRTGDASERSRGGASRTT